jgi:TnsA-like endonuclease N terminal
MTPSHSITETSLIADFDPLVTRIVAQPFLMKASIEGKLHKHIPDYWLLTEDGPLVIDVKPQARLDDPVVSYSLAWSRDVIESMGWRYEVATEQPRAVLENVRFLAGYRHRRWISQTAINELRSSNLDGLPFGEAVRRGSGPHPLIRAALLHMLWTHELTTDLSNMLCFDSVLRRAEVS